MILGCIADDFTGASDLGNTLSQGGLNVVQYGGVPKCAAEEQVHAGVVALKARSIHPEEAVAQSLAALRWLRAQGCQQYYFKYCSTFDSTPQGNIAPVAEALAEELEESVVIFCPAFPGVGRTVYQGHLFVGDLLLSNSPLKDHPLNPMYESDIRSWLSMQAKSTVGHVPLGSVFRGAEAIAEKLEGEKRAGHRLVVIDAITDSDLNVIAQAIMPRKLITGGSGLAIGLPKNYRAAGLLHHRQASWSGVTGSCVALCGSCSEVSRQQIAHHATSNPVLALDVGAILNGSFTAEDACQWALAYPGAVPLIHSSVDSEKLQVTQRALGREACAEALESFFAQLSIELVGAGVTKLIVAGGETSIS